MCERTEKRSCLISDPTHSLRHGSVSMTARMWPAVPQTNEPVYGEDHTTEPRFHKGNSQIVLRSTIDLRRSSVFRCLPDRRFAALVASAGKSPIGNIVNLWDQKDNPRILAKNVRGASSVSDGVLFYITGRKKLKLRAVPIKPGK